MSLRNKKEFQELGNALADFAAGRRVLLVENTGNWGDALILAGQDQLLRDYGVKTVKLSIWWLARQRPATIKLLSKLFGGKAVITGCGVYNGFYKRADEFCNLSNYFSSSLVMPSSFPSSPCFDRKKTCLYRRDNCESLDAVPLSIFCHDLAFYLNPAPRIAAKEVGYLFRQDIEKDGFDVPESNIDLSQLGNHLSSHEEFLDRIGEYRVVHTNRLHVGIGATLLGRQVYLYGSATRKVESIFRTSIAPNYDNVSFIGDFVVPGGSLDEVE